MMSNKQCTTVLVLNSGYGKPIPKVVFKPTGYQNPLDYLKKKTAKVREKKKLLYSPRGIPNNNIHFS